MVYSERKAVLHHAGSNDFYSDTNTIISNNTNILGGDPTWKSYQNTEFWPNLIILYFSISVISKNHQKAFQQLSEVENSQWSHKTEQNDLANILSNLKIFNIWLIHIQGRSERLESLWLKSPTKHDRMAFFESIRA